jgi:hypothetical protein
MIARYPGYSLGLFGDWNKVLLLCSLLLRELFRNRASADLLFADRRWRDGFAAGTVPSRVVPM